MVLTEDLRVRKQLLRRGHGLRTPRPGDLVTFSTALRGSESRGVRSTLVLCEAEPPFCCIDPVLLSMKEGERCLARLRVAPATDRSPPAKDACPTTDGAADPTAIPKASLDVEAEEELHVVVAMHHWQRRDSVPVPPPGKKNTFGEEDEARYPHMLKFEQRPGPYRNVHAIEHGSMVLVGFQPCKGPASKDLNTSTVPPMLVSWRIGEGSVPGYVEAAVSTMRLSECAAFDVPEEALNLTSAGPPFEGRTPLRRPALPDIDPLVASLFDPGIAGDDGPLDLEGNAPEGDNSSWPPPLQDCPLTVAWMKAGDPVSWEDLRLEPTTERNLGTYFRLALIAASEPPDVCQMDEEEQHVYFELERAHGNALAKVGRFAEASVAYGQALDAVRRTGVYKALFPTERGSIAGAYTLDPVMGTALEQLTPVEVDACRAGYVALHLNLALCASKEGRPADARKHSSIVLAANPDNAKALFRRGAGASVQGDYGEALPDLQRAAELLPQDRAVREELRTLQRKMKEYREVERAMLQKSFQPQPRTEQGHKPKETQEGHPDAQQPGQEKARREEELQRMLRRVVEEELLGGNK